MKVQILATFENQQVLAKLNGNKAAFDIKTKETQSTMIILIRYKQ